MGLNSPKGCPYTRFRGLRTAIHHRPRVYLTRAERDPHTPVNGQCDEVTRMLDFEEDTPRPAGKHVHLIGGGNSAGQAAMLFANYADEVTLLVRGPSLAASMSSTSSTSWNPRPTSPCSCTPRSWPATAGSLCGR